MIIPKINHIIDQISEWTGRIISWLVLLMVVVTFAIVAMRYVFNTGWIAVQESVTYMHAIVFLLGAAFALKHNQHVRVDIFYQRFSPRKQAWVDIFGTLFFLFPVCGFLIWSSWDYVASSWELAEGSREAGGLPWIYLLKTTIVIMPALLILQGIAELMRCALVISGHNDADKPSAERAEV